MSSSAGHHAPAPAVPWHTVPCACEACKVIPSEQPPPPLKKIHVRRGCTGCIPLAALAEPGHEDLVAAWIRASDPSATVSLSLLQHVPAVEMVTHDKDGQGSVQKIPATTRAPEGLTIRLAQKVKRALVVDEANVLVYFNLHGVSGVKKPKDPITVVVTLVEEREGQPRDICDIHLGRVTVISKCNKKTDKNDSGAAAAAPPTRRMRSPPAPPSPVPVDHAAHAAIDGHELSPESPSAMMAIDVPDPGQAPRANPTFQHFLVGVGALEPTPAVNCAPDPGNSIINNFPRFPGTGFGSALSLQTVHPLWHPASAPAALPAPGFASGPAPASAAAAATASACGSLLVLPSQNAAQEDKVWHEQPSAAAKQNVVAPGLLVFQPEPAAPGEWARHHGLANPTEMDTSDF